MHFFQGVGATEGAVAIGVDMCRYLWCRMRQSVLTRRRAVAGFTKLRRQTRSSETKAFKTFCCLVESPNDDPVSSYLREQGVLFA